MKRNPGYRSEYRASFDGKVFAVWESVPGQWNWSLTSLKTSRYGGRGFSTKGAAIAALTQSWLKLKLNYLREMVDDKAGLGPLLHACWGFKDALAPQALRDFLCEGGLGHLLEKGIIAPGNKAKVKWPPGWKEVAEAARA